MDLDPFRQFDPCGYAGLQVTQLRDLRPDLRAELDREKIGMALAQELIGLLR